MELVRKGKTELADKVFLTRWRKPLRLTAMTPCVKGKKCFVGWRACEPCLCPRYLTGGHYFTKDKSKTIQPQSCKE